ncbi:hypothetical protein CCR84_10380 [Rhodocyclus purpureus]|nr:hypothetical protein [Rhodocyclus purpureus]
MALSEDPRELEMLEAAIRLRLTAPEKVLFVSGDIEALLGFSPEDFLSGRVSLGERIHRDDLDLAERLWVTGNGAGSCNLRLRHADGPIRCIRAQFTREAGVLDLRLQDAKGLARPGAAEALLAKCKAMLAITGDQVACKDRNHVYVASTRRQPDAEDGCALTGLTDYDVFPEEEADHYYRLEQRVFAGEALVQEIREFGRNDGSRGWLDQRRYPLRDEQGEIVGVFCLSSEISGASAAGAGMRYREARFRRMFEDNLSIMLLICPETGKLLDANAAAASFYGHSVARMRTMNLRQIRIGPQQEIDADLALAKDKARVLFVSTHRLANGEERTVEVRPSPMRIDGRPMLFSIINDISERLLAEQALRDSEARLRLAAEAANFGIFEHDFASGETFCSAGIWTILGLSNAALPPPLAAIAALVHPDDAEIFAAIYARVVDPAGNGEIDDAVRIVRADGSIGWVQLKGLVQYEGEGSQSRPAKVHGVLIDITALKRVEQTLREAKEAADAATRAKGSFLANMSHEIRTPINVIIGLGHLLCLDELKPGQRRKLDELCNASEHLLALVNDILDLSKIETGQIVLDHSDFTLGTVVERAVRLFQGQAREKALQLAIEVAPRLLELRLNGDALRLSQVLINLLGNAIKFTERGSVRLCIDCAGAATANTTLRFAVCDTGCGIAAAAREHLFEPFVQADASTTREYGGSGLGLAISQRLVSLMGGTIQVDSDVGRGSCFSFALTLALGRGGEPERAPPAAAASDLSGVSVLLAEDHPQSQEIVLEMLERLGCRADVASDGAEAVECARAQRYDLILMDIQMPRLDGLDATRAIRELQGYRTTPIIALTAYAFAEDRQRCLDAGMSCHLGKPVTPAELARVIGQWLPGLSVTRAAAEPAVDDAVDGALLAIPGIEVDPHWCASSEQIAYFRSLLERFVNDKELAELFAHLRAGESAAAASAAHKLKGIAGFVGARRVAFLAGEIERALRQGKGGAVIEALARECAAEVARIASALKQPPASRQADNGTRAKGEGS